MPTVHTEVLAAAVSLADRGTWTFRLRDLVSALAHLNAATVRTHVSSRCCVNAPRNHQSRYGYFRALGRGTYCIEPAFRQRQRRRPTTTWHDAILASTDSGVDSTLIAASLTQSPTERLETMRRAALSLEPMRRP